MSDFNNEQRYGVRPPPVLRNRPACWSRFVSPASAATTVRARPRPMCTGCASTCCSMANAIPASSRLKSSRSISITWRPSDERRPAPNPGAERARLSLPPSPGTRPRLDGAARTRQTPPAIRLPGCGAVASRPCPSPGLEVSEHGPGLQMAVCISVNGGTARSADPATHALAHVAFDPAAGLPRGR